MTQDRKPTWQWDGPGKHDRIVLDGDWIADAGSIPDFPRLTPADGRSGGIFHVEASAVGRWDSGLIEFLWDAKRAAAAAGLGLDVAALPESAGKLLALLPDHRNQMARQPMPRFQPLRSLGDRTVGLLGAIGSIAFLAAGTVRAASRLPAGRARMRRIDLLSNIRDAGPSALVIVGVVNILTGAILAFVGAVQLRKFGADIYVANLVGLALVREMAAVMTAIVIAGRTGGAYAARIATMQGNQEIDALTVIGIPVTDYLFLPAILGLVVTVPFLYLYGCLIGMFGGFVVAVSMSRVTPAGYLHQTLAAVPLGQFGFGFVKSVAFALLIGVTSCHIGLSAGRSAADVGHAATRAVVIGIVGVIALDAVFAVFAEMAGI